MMKALVVIPTFNEAESVVEVLDRVLALHGTARGAGKWVDSTGDRSKFGLSALEIVDSFIGRMLGNIAAMSRVLDAETVRFERPHRVSFRLVKGPVPHVLERFELRPSELGELLLGPIPVTTSQRQPSRSSA